MKWFNDLRIKVKLMISFLIVALISGLIGYIGYNGITIIANNQDDLYSNRLLAFENLATVESSILTARGDIRSANDAKTPEGKQKYIASVKDNAAKADEAFASYIQTKLTSAEEKYCKIFQENWDLYKTERDKAIPLILDNQSDEALIVLDGSARKYLTNLRNALDELSKENISRADILDKNTDTKAKSDKSLLLLFIISGIVVSIGLGYFIVISIAKPLSALQEGANRIADGDFQYSSPYLRKQAQNKNEIGNVICAVIKMKNVIIEKSSWYEQILDAIPLPISVTDKTMNWTFVNKPVEQMLNKKRADF
ncbi:MAG: MCP four helix bundle domain-containing protein, partial [Bacteroidota bacterium]|nr:MCP four helix bundle domain-containing protein [Bacteroidota bacterium]